MSTSGNQGGICAAALSMRGTAAAGSLSASGRGGAQGCSPCWSGLNDVCFSRLQKTERSLIKPEFVIHYILYTTSTCGLLFCCFLRWYHVCSAHKTLESTTNYYISENVSAKQCNCHLEITKKKSHSETEMSAIFQNWVSVYSSLTITSQLTIMLLSCSIKILKWDVGEYAYRQRQGKQHSSCDVVVVQLSNDLLFTSSHKSCQVEYDHFAAFHQHGVMEYSFKV